MYFPLYIFSWNPINIFWSVATFIFGYVVFYLFLFLWSFTLKVLENDEPKARKLTIYEYFQQCYGIELSLSADFPCLDVGRPNHPKYLPVEVRLSLSLSLFYFWFVILWKTKLSIKKYNMICYANPKYLIWWVTNKLN